MKNKYILQAIFLMAVSVNTYAQTTAGMNINDFESNIRQLQGKTPEEVTKKLGKPKDVDKGYNKDTGTIECHLYEGIKDPKSGATVSTGNICFTNGKLNKVSPIYRY